jgi:peptidoglycan/LPS O-acetylase OafA/YrhL
LHPTVPERGSLNAVRAALSTAGHAAVYRPPEVDLDRPAPERAARPADGAGYRPDIDGLRAVAVLSVLFYHLGFAPFAGGYVGVDVFFVISGYLITRLITGQIDRQTFSLRTFYVRRIRRLLPALLATSTGSLVAGYFLFSPERLKELASSLIYASFSLSNWYFFRHSDYFAAESTTRPLLHTWSLSVEEQFYLVWPAFLLLITARPWRRWAPLAVASAGVISLILAVRFHAHTAALFYLTPFRAFELAIGAMMVWIGNVASPANWQREIALLTGLALIAIAVLALGGRGFSDVALLVPCLGAALVIYGGQARVAGLVLRNRLAVGVGLISYSIYLVHWPLLVFVQYWMLSPLTLAEQWIVVFATMVLATAMYYGVERRYRVRAASAPRSAKHFFAGYSLSLAAVVGVAAHMTTHGGWLWRYPPSIRPQISADLIAADTGYTWRAFRAAQHPFAHDGRRKVLLIGDSQGADILNMLAATGKLEHLDVSAIEVDMECQALISFDSAQYDALNDADRASCAAGRSALRDSSTIAEADVVILALNWDRRGVPFIVPSVSRLRLWGANQVVVVGRKSQWFSGPELLRRFRFGGQLERHAAARRNDIAWAANAQIAALEAPFRYVDLMSRMCPAPDRCRVLTDSGNVILFDGSHFTPDGARYIGSLLLHSGAFDF